MPTAVDDDARAWRIGLRLLRGEPEEMRASQRLRFSGMASATQRIGQSTVLVKRLDAR